MSDTRYDIYLSGQLLPQADRQQSVQRLAALFGIGADKVERLLDGKPHRIKQDADRETARQYLQLLKQAGAEAAAKAVGGAEEASTGGGGETGLDLAPPGTPVLRDDERPSQPAADIDVTHLELAPPGTEILQGHEKPAPPPPPPVDHLKLEEEKERPYGQ